MTPVFPAAVLAPGQQSACCSRGPLCLAVGPTATPAPGTTEVTYDQIREAFDRVASDYDRMEANPVHAYLRQVSVSHLLSVFRRGHRVLEIGCGTGAEAIRLAEAGVEVVATDISPRMLLRLAEKLERARLEGHVVPLSLAAGQVERLTGLYEREAFDGAFSSFGALNCEPDLRAFPARLAALLRPGAPFLLSVLNRLCLFDLLSAALGRPRRLLRRLGRGPVELPVWEDQRTHVPVRYLSRRAIARLFRPHFRVERVVGLSVLCPPFDRARLIEGMPRLAAVLRTLEARLGGRFPLNLLGDQILIQLRRN